MIRRAVVLLAAAFVLLAPAASHADLSSYTQDFESLVQGNPGALAGNGWKVFGNVFSPDGSTYYYGYGPFPAPNNTGAFCGIDFLPGTPPQGLQDLVVYSDYNNPDHGVGNLIEANVFQEQTIGAADVGKRWIFKFDAKLGNLESPSTALAFIKTLDPGNGYAMTNFITVNMTAIPSTWGTYSCFIDIPAGLVGQLLQFGFSNKASNYKGSGVFYDNVSLAMGPSPVTETTPTPTPNSAVLKTRIFNDCPSTTITTVNNYPDLISIQDAGLDCFGFANLHNWRFSTDGVNPIQFDNNASFRFSADLTLSGDGNGEGGLQLAPWWSPDVDGRFNVRTTDGEIACFGGRLPFFTFTGAFGLHYAKGNPIHLEVIYEPRGLNSGNPATIEYRLRYLGANYTSGAIPFDQANPTEDPPHGLWGMLYDAQAGGYIQCFNTPANPTTIKADYANIVFSTTPRPTSVVTKTRIFNDCPSSNVTVSNDYPHMITILDEGLDCFGFANLHNWHFSENGVTDVPFNNDAVFRFSADLTIRGDGNGEAGLQISPWWSKDVDGRFNVRSTDGEIACFGGRLPFYTFTGAYGLRYVKGTKIHLEMVYDANGNSAADPATIEYRLSYEGTDYTSGVIPFDMANPAEDPPYGLYGMLNDGRAGGYAQFFNTPGTPVSVSAEWRNVDFSSCLDPAEALLFMTPHKLNTNSTIPYMTAYIWPAPPLLASQIDVASLLLNGVPALTSPAPKVMNWDHTLRVKFDRAAVMATLTVGKFRTLNLEGEIAGQCFDISDYIDVNQPKMHHPSRDDVVIAGTQTQVTWDVDPDAEAIKLLQSADDGATWTVVASGIANTGTYLWNVPGQTAVGTRLALMNVYEQDAEGVVPDHEYAESEAFDIVSPTGVVGGEMAFALRAKNPSANGIQVSFSLPTSGPARLVVFDVAGREVVSSEVGGMAGTRSLRVGSDLPAGMYVLQLSSAGRIATSRAVVIR